MKLHSIFRFLLLFCAVLFSTSCTSIPVEETVREELIIVSEPSVCPPCTEIDKTNDADRELVSIFRDIFRYAAMSPEERRKAKKTLSANLNDKIAANNSDRIRLAGLLSLYGNLQNDQRALNLLSTVRKSEEASEDLHQFATALSRLLSVRVREMQKLQALSEMEKKLLQEKIGNPG